MKEISCRSSRIPKAANTNAVSQLVSQLLSQLLKTTRDPPLSLLRVNLLQRLSQLHKTTRGPPLSLLRVNLLQRLSQLHKTSRNHPPSLQRDRPPYLPLLLRLRIHAARIIAFVRVSSDQVCRFVLSCSMILKLLLQASQHE